MIKFDKFYDAKAYDVMTYPTLLMRKLAKNNKLNLIEDGSILMKFLSSASVLIQTQEEKKAEKRIYRVKEKPIDNRLAFLKAHMPHVIFIPGNNDLTQIEEAMLLLFQLKKSLATDIGKETAEDIISNIPIVISGLGGHGVTPGPIFASSEAAAIGHYLENFLQFKNHAKNPIFLEEKATNSGQNVVFTKPIMQKIEKNVLSKDKAYDGLRIWLVPTPVGGIRQLATLAQQAGPEYKIAEIFMLPDEKRIREKYLKMNIQDTCINVFAALRETVNYIGYLLDNDFMSPHATDERKMVAALAIVFKYHAVLTHKTLTESEKNRMISDILTFSQCKEQAGGLLWLNEDTLKMRDTIKKIFDPIKTYFQTAFNQIERQHMTHLSQAGLQPDQLALQQRKTRQFKASLFYFDAELSPNFSESQLRIGREKQHRKKFKI